MGTTVQQPVSLDAVRQEPDEQEEEPAPVPSDKTPQEFYVEITMRADVRAILEDLATA
jgi:hypothetical protein